jgi:hypothetical protein
VCEPELIEAAHLISRLNDESSRYNDAAWALEQTLHNLRLNAVGSTGIQHRIIADREPLLVELRKRIESAKALDKRIV